MSSQADILQCYIDLQTDTQTAVTNQSEVQIYHLSCEKYWLASNIQHTLVKMDIKQEG